MEILGKRKKSIFADMFTPHTIDRRRNSRECFTRLKKTENRREKCPPKISTISSNVQKYVEAGGPRSADTSSKSSFFLSFP